MDNIRKGTIRMDNKYNDTLTKVVVDETNLDEITYILTPAVRTGGGKKKRKVGTRRTRKNLKSKYRK